MKETQFSRFDTSVRSNVVSTLSVGGNLVQWTVLTHQQFPSHSIRIRETEALCDTSVKQYVGYLDVDDDHYFFWFFESRANPSTDPVVLWLNGGPGCSSLTGLLMELGPCRASEGGNGTTTNKYSWNTHANTLFLDQPINVGFSYGESKVATSDKAAENVYSFLQIFFQTYTEYSSLPLFVTGESYAGHYIPAIGHVLSQGNAAVKNNKAKPGVIEVQLAGLAIGNGLTDPLVQYEYYPDMACDTKYGPVLTEQECDDMRSKFGTCKPLIEACYNFKSAFTCVPGSIYCNNAMFGAFQKTGKNVYDVRKDCDPSNPLCYGILTDIETWLNNPEVQEELGVDLAYQGCNFDINRNFLLKGDWMLPYVNYIPPLLDAGLPILIYAGDADFICNWIGNKAWTIELPWDGQSGFQDAADKQWVSKITKKPAGEYRVYDNFAFVRVYEAGHMVPYDQPEHSLEMITHFIKSVTTGSFDL